MRLLLASLIFTTLGCADNSWKRLDWAALKLRPPHTIGGVIGHPPPPFYAQTMGRALTAPIAIGAVVAQTSGEQIIRENQVPDPSRVVSDRLLGALAKVHGLTTMTPVPTVTAKSVQWDTDLVLQVTTLGWQMLPFIDNWDRYRVHYVVGVELRDARDQRLLAAGSCEANVPRQSRDAPTWHGLLGHRASGLKEGLVEAATRCAKKYARELFAIRLADDPAPPRKREVDARTLYAPCNLEGTPAWQAADAAGKQRLLHECWERRQTAPPTPPAPPSPPPESPPGPGPTDEP